MIMKSGGLPPTEALLALYAMWKNSMPTLRQKKRRPKAFVAHFRYRVTDARVVKTWL